MKPVYSIFVWFQKSSIKLVPLETYVSPLKFTTTLCIVDKKSAWIICDADNLLMKIKLSYPIKEVLKINGHIFKVFVTLENVINFSTRRQFHYLPNISASIFIKVILPNN
jgi:hypothetical protein